MSDTQAKATPSKAARELAARLAFVAYGPYMATLDTAEAERAIAPYAELVQRSLSDLLEKASAVFNHAPDKSPLKSVVRFQRLKSEMAAALEPWQPK